MNVVLFSTQLDLRDNTTCQLVRSGPRNIHLYTVDVDIFSKGTPLGELPRPVYDTWPLLKSFYFTISDSFFNSSRLLNSEYSIVHKSDALRLLMIYQFGGLYLDVDYVVFNDLTRYKNTLVGNSKLVNWSTCVLVVWNISLRNLEKISVTNNAFAFDPKHPFIKAALDTITMRYNPQAWGRIGQRW